MPPERILLIRHGETDWNVEGRGQGFARTDLNANGQAQAQALAAHWSQRSIAAIYSSDLPRAWQTATPLATALNITPQTDERWREIHLGIFQGLTRDEARQQYPAETAARRADYWDYVTPGGESRRGLQARAYAAWQFITTQASGPAVAVVSHGGTIRWLLLKLFGENNARLDVSLTNTCVTTLAAQNGNWVLQSVAETPHL